MIDDTPKHDPSGGPAFPSVEAQIGNIAVGSPGMSLLQYFAARAPEEVPTWFKHTAEPLPAVFDLGDALNDDSEWRSLNDLDRDAVRGILQGGILSRPNAKLEGIARRAETAVEESKQARQAVVNSNAAARYFAWRWHYARQMVLGAGR